MEQALDNDSLFALLFGQPTGDALSGKNDQTTNVEKADVKVAKIIQQEPLCFNESSVCTDVNFGSQQEKCLNGVRRR